MSGNRKRFVALAFGVVTSLLAGLAWGVILRMLGEPIIDCVKDGVAGGGGAFVTALAVVVIFPFKDDPGTGEPAPPAQTPPRVPSA